MKLTKHIKANINNNIVKLRSYIIVHKYGMLRGPTEDVQVVDALFRF